MFEVAVQCKDVAKGKWIVLILTNFKKLIISLKVLYSFGSEVSDIKEHWNQGRRCQQRLVEDGGPRPVKVRLVHSGFFQGNNNNNNNKSTRQHLWTQRLNKSLGYETERTFSLIIRHSHRQLSYEVQSVFVTFVATRQAGSGWVYPLYMHT